MKICQLCNKEIPPKPNANNVKYCDHCRKEAYKYLEYRKQWHRNRTGRKEKGKIQCQLCGKWYRKPMSHAWQIHGISEKEYKEHFGLERKGIIPEPDKEVLQEHVKNNFNLVVKINLLNKGKKTRFIKGDKRAGRYQRSETTLKRLKEQLKRNNYEKSKNNVPHVDKRRDQKVYQVMG